MVSQLLHVAFQSFPSAIKAGRARREMSGVTNSYMVPVPHDAPSGRKASKAGREVGGVAKS